MIHTSLALAHSAIERSSARVYTAPVGLHGEQRIRPRVNLLLARSRSRALTLSPHSRSPGTSTGSARQRCTIWGYDTQAGAGMSTRSLGPNRVKQALKMDCFEPELTMIRSGSMERPPDIRLRFCAMAFRSSAMPTLGG